MKTKVFITVLLMGWFSFQPAYSMARETATLIKVLDSGTLFIHYAEHREKMRLIGVTVSSLTPEDNPIRFSSVAPYKGDRVLDFMAGLLKAGDVLEVEFDQQRYDKHGNLLAYVYLSDGRMLNEELLKDGLAKPLTVLPNMKYQKKLKKAYQKTRQK